MEPTDKVIGSPFMAKSNDDPHAIQPNDARGAHEAPNSSPHFNQRKKNNEVKPHRQTRE